MNWVGSSFAVGDIYVPPHQIVSCPCTSVGRQPAGGRRGCSLIFSQCDGRVMAGVNRARTESERVRVTGLRLLLWCELLGLRAPLTCSAICLVLLSAAGNNMRS